VASKAEEYRRRAQQCLEMARTFGDNGARATLAHMAQAGCGWRIIAKMPRGPQSSSNSRFSPTTTKSRPVGWQAARAHPTRTPPRAWGFGRRLSGVPKSLEGPWAGGCRRYARGRLQGYALHRHAASKGCVLFAVSRALELALRSRASSGGSLRELLEN